MFTPQGMDTKPSGNLIARCVEMSHIDGSSMGVREACVVAKVCDVSHFDRLGASRVRQQMPTTGHPSLTGRLQGSPP